MPDYRIHITRSGYAVVSGETEGQALENAKMLREGDFDWERIDSDMIDDSAEIVEQL